MNKILGAFAALLMTLGFSLGSVTPAHAAYDGPSSSCILSDVQICIKVQWGGEYRVGGGADFDVAWFQMYASGGIANFSNNPAIHVDYAYVRKGGVNGTIVQTFWSDNYINKSGGEISETKTWSPDLSFYAGSCQFTITIQFDYYKFGNTYNNKTMDVGGINVPC